MKPDGKGGQVDITQITDFRKLPPSIQAGTRASFETAIDQVYPFVKAGHKISGELTPEEVSALEKMRMEAGNAIHEKWIEMNKDWASKDPDAKKLLVPFNQLPKDEQDKDLKFVDLVLDRLRGKPHSNSAIASVGSSAKRAKEITEVPVDALVGANRKLASFVDSKIPGAGGRALANVVSLPANIYDLWGNTVAQGIARFSGRAKRYEVALAQSNDALKEATETAERAKKSGNSIAINNAQARLKAAAARADSAQRNLNYQKMLDQPVNEEGKYIQDKILQAKADGKILTKQDLAKIRKDAIKQAVENQTKNLVMAARGIKLLEENPAAPISEIESKLASTLHEDWRVTLTATHAQIDHWVASQSEGSMSAAEKKLFDEIKANIAKGQYPEHIPRIKNAAGRVPFTDGAVAVDIANTPFDKVIGNGTANNPQIPGLPDAWKKDNLDAATNIITALQGARTASGGLNSPFYKLLAGIPLDSPDILSRVHLIFSRVQSSTGMSSDPLIAAASNEYRNYLIREGRVDAQQAASWVVMLNILSNASDALDEVNERTEQIHKIADKAQGKSDEENSEEGSTPSKE